MITANGSSASAYTAGAQASCFATSLRIHIKADAEIKEKK